MQVDFRGELIQPNPDKDFLFVTISSKASELFPTKGMSKARGEVNGVEFECSVQPMKDGTHRIFVNKKLREDAKLQHGEVAEFSISKIE